MPPFLHLFDCLFNIFSNRKAILYSASIAIILVSLITLKNVELTEDIQAMLPDGSSNVALDFQLLQQAPFAQKVIINLESGQGVDKQTLTATADNLAGHLTHPYYTRVVTGPDMPSVTEFLPWLLQATPILMHDEDMQNIAGVLTPEQVSTRLHEVKNRLNTPEGWASKTLLLDDPLGLYRIGLEKLRYLNMFQGMVIYDSHFMSLDGKSVLVIGETPIKLTDAQGAKKLNGFTQAVINEHVPQGINGSFISGHSYTAANAEILRNDLTIILTVAPFVIFILLLVFMRNWRAIFVFLVPTSVVCIATAGILHSYHTISAITIAFGSVLMGIADDYPIFTYFSLRNRESYGGRTISEIAKPVLASGITTMATFSALFFSELPGQRQIAWFSIIGVVASLTFSLVVLPHLLKGLPPAIRYSSAPVLSTRFPRSFIIGCWLVVIALSIWQGTALKFNGDMRAINMVPQSLRATEASFRKTWGDVRGKALIFVEGRDLQSALRNNDLVFDYLKKNLPDIQTVSLAPLLPSVETQQENFKRWSTFWTQKNKDKLRALLAMEGGKLGFVPNAFDSFVEKLSVKPVPLSIESLQRSGFGDVINSMIIQHNNTTRIFTLVPDTPEVSSFFDKSGDIPFVSRFISQRRFNDTMGSAIFNNFVKYLVIASIVIIVFLVVLFRDIKKVLCALIPVATGLLVMFGAMGWSKIEFNLFNIIASILVIGLSVDLGIFMVSKITEGYDRNTGMAVLLGGLTSLVGMGALVIAHHPALYSIGITVLLGMCGAIPSALFVIPPVWGTREHKT